MNYVCNWFFDFRLNKHDLCCCFDYGGSYKLGGMPLPTLINHHAKRIHDRLLFASWRRIDHRENYAKNEPT